MQNWNVVLWWYDKYIKTLWISHLIEYSEPEQTLDTQEEANRLKSMNSDSMGKWNTESCIIICDFLQHVL